MLEKSAGETGDREFPIRGLVPLVCTGTLSPEIAAALEKITKDAEEGKLTWVLRGPEGGVVPGFFRDPWSELVVKKDRGTKPSNAQEQPTAANGQTTATDSQLTAPDKQPALASENIMQLWISGLHQLFVETTARLNRAIQTGLADPSLSSPRTQACWCSEAWMNQPFSSRTTRRGLSSQTAILTGRCGRSSLSKLQAKTMTDISSPTPAAGPTSSLPSKPGLRTPIASMGRHRCPVSFGAFLLKTRNSAKSWLSGGGIMPSSTPRTFFGHSRRPIRIGRQSAARLRSAV